MLTPPVGPEDHILGLPNAPVTLVEYGDFECPYCGMAYSVVKQIIELFGKELRFAFRHFPITEIHPHAAHAAEAAEAAGVEGKFWSMHDMLYEHQNALDDESLAHYAKQLKLNPATFKKALREEIYKPRIESDFWSGVHSGVNGTPTFFINGQRYDGSWEFDSLITALNKATEAKYA
jgi:protein-disulfide isomerase